MAKVLLHICCGPCALYPVSALREEGFEVYGFFYNPNIHPYLEYLKRKQGVEKASQWLGLKMLWKDEYQLKDWLRRVCFREEQRCQLCYHLRLEETARYARRGKFDFFTSTLLYSKQQNQELILELGESIAREQKVKFLFRDFREGWREGIEKSKKLGLYRQQYCGCIYSEYERFRRVKKIEEEKIESCSTRK